MTGTHLFEGKYKILKVLGQGGMGKVYLAENIKLGTLWAIKEIPKRAGSRVDILVEPNMLKKLDHPALPRIFDIVEDEENIYTIVDYIEGVSLDKELKEKGRFPEETVIEWARQICEVLVYLHGLRPHPVIYRDMKPSNIILTPSGNIKLIDFGIAREYKQESGSDTVYIGTRGYAAPEQYGSGQTSVRTDIYSLGVTLFHLVTGKSPNEQPFEIKNVRNFDKDLSEDIESIINKCTKHDPRDRYQSAGEILEKITGVMERRRTAGERVGDGTVPHKVVHGRRESFKKLVLTIWDNGEFGCELAYTAAKLTDFRVMLMDLDLLAPSVDMHLNVRKYPDGCSNGGMFNNSGLNIVMDSISRDSLTAELLEDASVKRRELKNLFILTGNYKLDNYEYYSNDSLVRLLEKAYQYFDITILLVNRSIYDSYTIISLIKSDYNIIPLNADICKLREFNSCLVFLKEKQHISLDKTKFAAYEFDSRVNLNAKVLEGITEFNYLGSISYSRRRARYRNLKVPYARRIEGEVMKEYIRILRQFNIIPRIPLTERITGWARGLLSRRDVVNAGNRYSP